MEEDKPGSPLSQHHKYTDYINIQTDRPADWGMTVRKKKLFSHWGTPSRLMSQHPYQDVHEDLLCTTLHVQIHSSLWIITCQETNWSFSVCVWTGAAATTKQLPESSAFECSKCVGRCPATSYLEQKLKNSNHPAGLHWLANLQQVHFIRQIVYKAQRRHVQQFISTQKS